MDKHFEVIAETIAGQAGLSSRVLLLLLERAAREGYEYAIDTVAGA